MTTPPIMLFHRDFRGYSGGHGKVWDYFNHALAIGWDARVYFTPQSLHDASNPWLAVPERVVDRYAPEVADALFIGGMDWLALSDDVALSGKPVFNLIQHVRHGDPQHPLYAFLTRPAQRICVSAQVASAIRASGRVNGQVTVIEAALNLSQTAFAGARESVFIDGIKQSELARELAAVLRAEGRKVVLCDHPMPRTQYLAAMAQARVAVTLPHPTEGFYLPGLEAMALGCASVVPDCVGNRAYLEPGNNALAPALQCTALADAVRQLDDPLLHAQLLRAGAATAARFTLARERAAFQRLAGSGPGIAP